MEGYRTALMLLQEDVAREERMAQIYTGLAEGIADRELQSLFEKSSRDAGGHVEGLSKIIKEIEQGEHDVQLFCPSCGSTIEFGRRPKEGAVLECPTCGERVRLVIREGDYKLVSMET